MSTDHQDDLDRTLARLYEELGEQAREVRLD
mgnify:CR=1 FL=1